MVSGTVVTVYVFLATERIWRERLPQLFPDGDLSATHAPTLRVRTRLIILFMLMAVLPVGVLSVATLVRTGALMRADAGGRRVGRCCHPQPCRNSTHVGSRRPGRGIENSGLRRR